MPRPLKKHAALIALSQYHHFGLLLSWKIGQGINREVETPRIVDYQDYFVQNHLEPHFQMEEEVFFSFLAKNDLMRKEAEEQHASIRKHYAAISEERGDRDRLSAFADEREAYTRFEERKLFQYMQVELLKEDLENIRAIHQKVTEEWPDEFWGKSKV